MPLEQPPHQLPPPRLQLFFQLSVLQPGSLAGQPLLRLRELLPGPRESLIAAGWRVPLHRAPSLCDPVVR